MNVIHDEVTNCHGLIHETRTDTKICTIMNIFRILGMNPSKVYHYYYYYRN